MKVLPFTIPKPKKDTLLLQEDKGPSFYALLHQHEELQISYIKEGEGALIVGDTVTFFKTGDIIVLGGNLPHVFKSDTSKGGTSHMRTVFFTESSFGVDFFMVEELKSLQSFFRKAANGFRVLSKNTKIKVLLEALFSASKLDRFILFLQLLKEVNTAKYESLSFFVSEKKYNDIEGQRMSAVFEYTMNHFQKEITLNTIAAEAAMTKNAFCRYFRKRTNKTYVTFLNELRIEEACKLLLVNTEFTIAEIAELCGFQNISNFNRVFKTQKGKTPRAFRKGAVFIKN